MADAILTGLSLGDIHKSLDRHARRRAEALPTISTLVGDCSLVVSTWQNWCERTNRTVRILEESQETSLTKAFAASLIEASQILEACLAAAAQVLGLKPTQLQTELRTRGSRELEGLAHRVTEGGSTDVATVFAWVVESVVERRPIDSATFLDALASPRFRGDSWEALGRLLELVPKTSLPGILVVADRGPPSGDQDAAEQLELLVQQVATAAITFPKVPLGVAISSADFERLLKDVPDSLSKALVRESIVRVMPTSAGEVGPAVVDPGDTETNEQVDVPDPSTIDSSATETATIDEAATAVLKAVQKAHDDARSEAERFLFKLLNEDPQLTGLFKLNVKPGIAFGKSSMEIDLACVSLKIAVEVDGFWHFTTADRYRTDRRKDLELQRNDYLILRVLAEDVVPRMQEIRDRVREVVAYRKQNVS